MKIFSLLVLSISCLGLVICSLTLLFAFMVKESILLFRKIEVWEHYLFYHVFDFSIGCSIFFGILFLLYCVFLKPTATKKGNGSTWEI